MTLHSTSGRGLRANCLSFPETVAQSVALIAPATISAAIIPIVFASAGNGTWLAYAIATAGVILVTYNINQFARRFAAAGALYIYVARGLGSTPGILCGWALTLAYILLATGVQGGFAHYANLVLQEFGVQLPSVLLFAIFMGLGWYYAHTDIQLSAVLILLLEVVSVGVILLLALLVLLKNGFSPDIRQLTLAEATPSGISFGSLAAILSFVGFESATTLGDEAKRPTRSIPRALIWSVGLSGLFFILLSYTEVSGFRNSIVPLNDAPAPLQSLANLTGEELLGLGINVGLMSSFLGCAIAGINAGARIALSLSCHHVYPLSLSKVHRQNETPYFAVTLFSGLAFLIAASMSLFGLSDLDIYGYIGTIATYGFLCTYILISIATPFYLSHRGQLRRYHIVISVLAVLFMLVPIIGSFYPAPAFPFNVFPYLFLLYLAVGGWLFLVLRSRTPQILENLQNDLEAVN